MQIMKVYLMKFWMMWTLGLMLLTWQLSQRSKYHPRLEIALEQVVLNVKMVVKVLVRVKKVSRNVDSSVNSVVGRL